MNPWMLYCLMVQNVSLTNSTRTTLYDAAVRIVHEGRDSLTFKTGEAEGVVKKTHNFLPFFGQGGPAFVADLETDKGKGKASFIVADSAIATYDEPAEKMWINSDEQRANKAQWN